MSWITVDTGLPNHPKMAALPNDLARYGWFLTLLAAKEQRTPGTFADPIHFRHVMGKFGRYLTAYVSAGLIDEVDGRLDIHDWPDYQRDRTATERQRRHRDGSVTVTDGNRDVNVTRAGAGVVAVAVDVVSTEGVQGEPDAAVSFRDRTGQFPGPTILRWLNELSEAHGEQRLVDMIGSTPMTGTNVSDYLRSVREVLRVEDHRTERAEKADEARRLEEKRRPIPLRPVEESEISDEEADRIAREYMVQAKAMQP